MAAPVMLTIDTVLRIISNCAGAPLDKVTNVYKRSLAVGSNEANAITMTIKTFLQKK